MGRVKEWGIALAEQLTTQGVLEGLDYETAYRDAWVRVFGFDPEECWPDPPNDELRYRAETEFKT